MWVWTIPVITHASSELLRKFIKLLIIKLLTTQLFWAELISRAKRAGSGMMMVLSSKDIVNLNSPLRTHSQTWIFSLKFKLLHLNIHHVWKIETLSVVKSLNFAGNVQLHSTRRAEMFSVWERGVCRTYVVFRCWMTIILVKVTFVFIRQKISSDVQFCSY